MIVDNPCYPECPERSAECHSTCERYKEYCKNIKEKNKLMKQMKDAEQARVEHSPAEWKRFTRR